MKATLQGENNYPFYYKHIEKRVYMSKHQSKPRYKEYRRNSQRLEKEQQRQEAKHISRQHKPYRPYKPHSETNIDDD